MIDLEDSFLEIGDPRVVAGWKAQASDGKSDAGRRDIPLDTFTAIYAPAWGAAGRAIGKRPGSDDLGTDLSTDRRILDADPADELV
jgi:hypothetical protein